MLYIIYMKKYVLPILMIVAVILLDGCAGSKNVAYFQNANEINLTESKGLYDAHIRPKDILTITVSTTDPLAARPFNLVVSSPMSPSGSLNSGYGGSLQTYLVDNNGQINFPIIGRITVGGLTKTDCESMITEKIKPYMAEKENPVVTVQMASYKVTVIGEVQHPGTFPVAQEKINVLEAIAQAGDLSIYGKRENVMLIREKADGEKEIHRLNLNDANLFNSPYYYLQQNDVIYVEPNRVKTKDSAIAKSTTLWLSFIGIVTSVASLLVNILKD